MRVSRISLSLIEKAVTLAQAQRRQEREIAEEIEVEEKGEEERGKRGIGTILMVNLLFEGGVPWKVYACL